MMDETRAELLKTGFFSRHETFCPRYGWLKKGVDGVSEYADIFEQNDAIERLGVGKNMVRSIRFWCLAFKLVKPEERTGGKKIGGPMRTTRFADKLLGDDGWDPYLEDPASLWLLHWKLFAPPILAPAWAIALNQTAMGGFAMKDLSRLLIEVKDEIPEFQRLADSSFEKDASCFIRMYGPPGRRRAEEIDCPFTHLDLVVAGEEKGRFAFNFEEKPRLPDLIFLAACFDFAENYHKGQRTLSLNKLAYDFNGPGVVFKLSESDIGHRLERGTAALEGVGFTESYGNRQLQMDAPPILLWKHALEAYYQNRRGLRL